ncbi:11S seed storage globulin B [Quillaja saponaria]|uniref:11S seed storage globulin B n=1 Tax=Quillaja saponaria TaxID=32244 RepID=A0AAD7VIQ0_QUISA|nr:11S seed storage globulin B [Quillaja saponaria]
MLFNPKPVGLRFGTITRINYVAPVSPFVKRTNESNGLHLPSYVNSPQLHYVIQGGGILGIVFPGCAETFEESEQKSQLGERGERGRGRREQHGQGQRFQEQQQDRHQKIRHVREGDVIAMPAGVAYWGYNHETIRKIQGENDNRSNIVKVQRSLSVIRPRERREGEQEEKEERRERTQERERERRRGGGRGGNGLEETICSLRVEEYLNDPQRADIYNPQAGRISTLNSFNLPILNNLQLSAERVGLYRNGIYAPHWNINAHSILYVTRGRGRVQIVDHNGNQVFDGEVEEGQLLTVPQNFAVARQAGNERFEYIAFQRNYNAIINPLVGRTSAIRALPEDVVANAFQIRLDDARQLKFNRNENILFSGNSRSGRSSV